MRVNLGKRKQATVNIPAYLRDKFKMCNGDRVEVDTDGERIIIIMNCNK